MLIEKVVQVDAIELIGMIKRRTLKQQISSAFEWKEKIPFFHHNEKSQKISISLRIFQTTPLICIVYEMVYIFCCVWRGWSWVKFFFITTKSYSSFRSCFLCLFITREEKVLHFYPPTWERRAKKRARHESLAKKFFFFNKTFLNQ